MRNLLLGAPAQKLRLVSGLALFAFAAAHFINAALGLVSLEAMETFRLWRTQVTRSAPGGVILGLALAAHVALALARVAGRRSLRLRPWEWAQLLSGFAIPFLLFPHIVNTRAASTFFGVNDTYAYELARMWPGSAGYQSALLLLVWAHACLGLHMWLRQEPRYLRWAPALLSLAVLVPALALAGFAVQGREMAEALAAPGAREALRRASNWPDAAAEARLDVWRELSWRGFYALAAVAAAVAAGRLLAARLSSGVCVVDYAGGPAVQARRGDTILETSRAHGVPHHSACGGRARCSTCRVRVIHGMQSLSPPDETEMATLRAIGAGADVRLACQARIMGPVTVMRLLAPQRGVKQPFAGQHDAAGVEREFAVLFADIRGFTRMSEARLPYDTVFVLNRVFAVLGAAIEQAGGRIEKYIGDGLLALFDGPDGARDALLAAREIDLALDQLNQDLAGELDEPVRVALALHVGPLVVGRIGWGGSAAITVIGPTVNVASRIESIAKQEDVQLAFSLAAAESAGLAPSCAALRRQAFQVKGVAGPVEVVLAPRARDLPLGDVAPRRAAAARPAGREPARLSA
ncbi:adenylate/guanylate cyclase domain-containing protein [Camelimonas abortus]|uniref:Adenylate/guanylate cyclase domain-containing protein n=1 Tax=Camelimonas abortus TaxID=1017184 RepID=A0ABV7LEE0_9HYPH